MNETSDKGRTDKKHVDFPEALSVYLADPSSENLKATIEVVKSEVHKDDHCVELRFWGSDWFYNLEGRLIKLRDGDRETWAKLLFGARDCPRYSFDRLKEISPFAGKMVVSVFYGLGFIVLSGDANPMFDSLVRSQFKGFFDMHVGDRNFVVILDEPDASKVEIYQAPRPSND